MQRVDIINTVGERYRKWNTEAGEFSYVAALKSIGKNISDYQRGNETHHNCLDIRFENDRLVILVETKKMFRDRDKVANLSQLQDYVRFEEAYSGKKIVAILAETEGDGVWVWYGRSVIIDEEHREIRERVIKSFDEYEDICFGRVNDKIRVVDSIKILNEKLHANGVAEKLRSQFVGTCLLALQQGLDYKDVKETIGPDGHTLKPEESVLNRIKDILAGLLRKCAGNARPDDADNNPVGNNLESKITIINNTVLGARDITGLNYAALKDILQFIDGNIVPYINNQNTAGQDLLSLFFTTFNKYVGKSDKNQAFTPDHICDFMCKAVGINRNSRVLDPCCGSGAFLVRAMTNAMSDCDTEAEIENVRRSQIFGIERDTEIFGLASTNMLIHGYGNSNVVQGSMFDFDSWIKENDVNVVLMNPPYNASKAQSNPGYTAQWKASTREDPSRGFHFVEWIAGQVAPDCKMAVLLPTQAAIGNSDDIRKFKKTMLDKYTLDAVFSLPIDVFYPGASAVAVCMIFDLSMRHEAADRETFFGYFRDDGFVKRKGLGRVEMIDGDGESLWTKTERLWLDLYRNRRTQAGLSVTHKVTYKDEWLAEAYMETDYSALTENDFQRTLNDYLAYQIKSGRIYED